MGRVAGYAFALGVAACSSFTIAPSEASDAGTLADAATEAAVGDGAVGACVPVTCEDAGPSCVSYSFAPGACPPEWSFKGDTTGVVRSCDGGQLHLQAAGTLDNVAKTSVAATSPSYSVHISVRIAVNAWDGGALFAVGAADAQLFAVSAELSPAGEPRIRWCDAALSCSASSFDAKLGESHVFDFRIRSSGVTATVDCKPFGTAPSVQLVNQMRFDLTFGKVDGNSIDGTIDDVVVRFEEP